MVFKSIERRREYQRQWIKEKRARAKAEKLSEGEKAVLVAMYEAMKEGEAN